jgi:ATP-binding cassette subfamily B multidrug efflux pump
MADGPSGGIHDEEVLGKAYDARLVRRLAKYVRPYWLLVAISVVLLSGDAALQLVGPALTRQVIDVDLPARAGPAIRDAAILFALSLVVQFGCQYGETMLTSLLGQRVIRDLRLELFTHLQYLAIAFFDRNPVGRLMTRVTSDIEALNELFTSGVVAGLGDLFTLIAIAVWMLVLDWRLALAAFAVIPLVYLTSHLFRIKVRRSYRDIRTRLARINAFLQERLTGMRIVQLFGREKSEAGRFDTLNRSHLDANLQSITYYALYFPAIEVLTSIALAMLLVTGARRALGGSLTVGTLAAFLLLVRRFYQPLQDLSDKYNILQQAMAASERVFRLLDEPEGQGVRGTLAAAPVGRRPPERRKETTHEVRAAGLLSPLSSPLSTGAAAPVGVVVAFEDVWFAYDVGHLAADGGAPHQPEWVLKGVSFRVSPGETVALVGHTGAGKTTVVSLLMRFYDPQRGRITLDGVDIREMPLADLRSRIGYVQQDIFLFAGDVASNIRLSSPLPDAEVIQAAARVGADRIIQRLPGAYHYELGERGASISVGERQLLAFARAIAANPSLLILDEATSAVDSEIEAEIQAALKTLMAGRTTIAVAHRLSTIVDADEILVMQHGEVRERGTHRELLALGGAYEHLYRLQVGEPAATI